jgi:putative signal transducing protein
MRPILNTGDLSLIESAQIALEAEGIQTVTRNENSAGIPGSLTIVAVMEDADYERALAVVRTLQLTPPQPWWRASGTRKTVRASLIALLILVAVLCGTIFIR